MVVCEAIYVVSFRTNTFILSQTHPLEHGRTLLNIHTEQLTHAFAGAGPLFGQWNAGPGAQAMPQARVNAQTGQIEYV